MQVYKDADFHHHHAATAPYNMPFSHSQHSQHSQQPQHPYNPYPHQHQNHQHQPSCPQYTLRSGASLAAASARDSNSSSEPPQDMFFALERLLMGISPFPPSMPTNLAEPTCPSLDDQAMSEMTPSSSSLSPSTSSAPSEPSEKHSSGESLAQFYEDRESRPQQQPQSSFQTPRLQYRQQLAGSDCSARSMSPPASPYSYMSSSPATKAEASRDMPYWSPSTPSLQIEHQWSNHSSPLLSQQQHPLPADQKHSSDSWGYPLFEQLSLPMSMSDLGTCVAPSACQHSASSPKSTQSFDQSMSGTRDSSTATIPMGTVPLNARRAARTPPHRRTSSELSGLRAYESMAYRDYNPHRYYRNASSATSPTSSCTNNNCSNGSSSSSSSSNNNNNSYNQSSACNYNNNNHSNNSSSNTARISNHNTRGGIKSYPCPTCTKPFPTRTQLKSHMAIHTDNFPFPCLYAGCDLHFKRKHDLRRHVDAKHALVKKYLCSGGCGEGFGRRDQMVRHLRRGACGQGFQTE
ncbi:hypothetical protein BGZ72_010518 [Mortierella alpina]|nr:hypothetical protein BGZ72_010518 [Mortierella alpina]